MKRYKIIHSNGTDFVEAASVSTVWDSTISWKIFYSDKYEEVARFKDENVVAVIIVPGQLGQEEAKSPEVETIAG